MELVYTTMIYHHNGSRFEILWTGRICGFTFSRVCETFVKYIQNTILIHAATHICLMAHIYYSNCLMHKHNHCPLHQPECLSSEGMDTNNNILA